MTFLLSSIGKASRIKQYSKLNLFMLALGLKLGENSLNMELQHHLYSWEGILVFWLIEKGIRQVEFSGGSLKGFSMSAWSWCKCLTSLISGNDIRWWRRQMWRKRRKETGRCSMAAAFLLVHVNQNKIPPQKTLGTEAVVSMDSFLQCSPPSSLQFWCYKVVSGGCAGSAAHVSTGSSAAKQTFFLRILFPL